MTKGSIISLEGREGQTIRNVQVTEEYVFLAIQIFARKCLEYSPDSLSLSLWGCHRWVVLKERFQRRAKRNAVEFQRKSIHPPSLCDSNVAVVRA